MTEWYYRDSTSRKVGPLTPEQFEEHVAHGDVTPETRVWRSGMVEWTTYGALLAHDSQCTLGASGPAASAAPESSSYCTLIALGASATSRPAHGSGRATPVATDCGFSRGKVALCPECQEEVASHLFREVGRRWICGFCFQQREVKARRDRLREAKGVDSNWLGKWLVRCALVAAVFVLARVFLFEMGSKRENASTLPAVEDLSSAVPRMGATAPRAVDVTDR